MQQVAKNYSCIEKQYFAKMIIVWRSKALLKIISVSRSNVLLKIISL